MVGATIIAIIIIIVIAEAGIYLRKLKRAIEELQIKVSRIEKMIEK